MRPLEFGWYLPTHGDTTAYGLMDAQIPGSPELCDRVVQAAEAAGFEYLLIPVGSVCWEAWIAGAFMAARSSSVNPFFLLVVVVSFFAIESSSVFSSQS